MINTLRVLKPNRKINIDLFDDIWIEGKKTIMGKLTLYNDDGLVIIEKCKNENHANRRLKELTNMKRV